jgi:hypothetical protein
VGALLGVDGLLRYTVQPIEVILASLVFFFTGTSSGIHPAGRAGGLLAPPPIETFLYRRKNRRIAADFIYSNCLKTLWVPRAVPVCVRGSPIPRSDAPDDAPRMPGGSVRQKGSSPDTSDEVKRRCG